MWAFYIISTCIMGRKYELQLHNILTTIYRLLPPIFLCSFIVRDSSFNSWISNCSQLSLMYSSLQHTIHEYNIQFWCTTLFLLIFASPISLNSKLNISSYSINYNSIHFDDSYIKSTVHEYKATNDVPNCILIGPKKRI
jgi:hypothetical protein